MLNGDIEDVKHAIAQRFGWPAFTTLLAAIDAEKSNGITTDLPAAVFEGEKMTPSGQGYPVAEVIGVETVYSGDPQQAKEAFHSIDVVWTQAGDDELTIVTRLERLARATRDLFWNGTLEEIGSAPVQVLLEGYTDLRPATDHPFVKGAVVRMLVKTYAV